MKTLSVLSVVLLFSLSAVAADDKKPAAAVIVPPSTEPTSVPTELAAEFFAADNQLLRVQQSMIEAGKSKEMAMDKINRFCGDKLAPAIDPKTPSKIICNKK